jgi:hypothetical protein
VAEEITSTVSLLLADVLVLTLGRLYEKHATKDKLTAFHAWMAYRRRRGIFPFILNLGSRRR